MPGTVLRVMERPRHSAQDRYCMRGTMVTLGDTAGPRRATSGFSLTNKLTEQ